MLTKLVILGTGGNCRDILDTVRDINQEAPRFECLGFLDDNESQWGTLVDGLPVIGGLTAAASMENVMFVNGIGSWRNYWRKPEMIARTGLPSDRFATIIHPSAVVARTAHLGQGTVVLPHCTVGAGARLGNHIMVLPNCIVSHDAFVGDYTSITGGVRISGNVTIGQSCYLGSGCCVNNGVTIHDRSLVGMGSVVLRDVPPDTVVAGNPARLLRSR